MWFARWKGRKQKNYLTPLSFVCIIAHVMEKIVRQGMLFDLYGELLTEHQREIYGCLVNDDMSLSELAEQYGISRQGVHDMIRRCEKILADYEDRLHLVEHFLKVKKMVGIIHRYAEEISVCDDREKMQERIADIKNISSEILEQY